MPATSPSAAPAPLTPSTQRLCRADQAGGLVGHHDLRVGRGGDRLEGAQLHDREGVGLDQRLVDRLERRGLALAAQRRRRLLAVRSELDGLLLPLGREDGRLLLPFGLEDRRLLAALRSVDGGLLLPLRLEDRRALVLLGLLLLGHRLEHVVGRRDVENLDAVEPDPPLERGLGHVLLHLRVDGVALGEGLVERELAEDRAQGGACHLVDREPEVVDLEQRELHVGDLAEDGRAHLQRHVVLGDDRLLVARPRELADVHLVHPVGEGEQHVEARLADGPELAEALDHPHAALLDHLQRGLEEDDDQGEDGEPEHRHPDVRCSRTDDHGDHLPSSPL